MGIAVNLRPLVRNVRTAARATRYGRPTGHLSTRDFASRYPEHWRPLSPQEAPNFAPPRQFGPEAAAFERVEPIPEIGIVAVPRGTIIGPHGWVFMHDGRLLVDCAWPYRTTAPMKLPASFPKPRHLHGTCLNIASDWSNINYAHFVLDSMGRYGLFTQSGLDLSRVDFIYAPKPDSDLTRDLMVRLGIPLSKCIWAHENPHIRADRVLAPSFPGSRYNRPASLMNFIQGARAPSGEGPKRIYVPRGKDRNISNEAEILDIVRSLDFEVYDWTKWAGHQYFSDADIIIGPHGAGLTNMIFSSPGSDVLDLIPSDHAYPFFYTLAASVGIKYNYIMGNSSQNRMIKDGPSPYNFWIDPEVVRTAIETLIEERRSSMG